MKAMYSFSAMQVFGFFLLPMILVTWTVFIVLLPEVSTQYLISTGHGCIAAQLLRSKSSLNQS